MEKKNEIVLIVGKKGYGKTTLARAIAQRQSRVMVFDPMADFGAGIVGSGTDIAQWMRAKSRRQYTAICRPTSDDDAEMFWATVGDRSVRDCTVIIDEIDRVCTPSWTHPVVHDLIHYGRHRSISIVGTCRRPSNTSRDLSANADSIVAFRVDEPRDVDYLRRWMDVAGIETLEPLEYIQRERCRLMEGL